MTCANANEVEALFKEFRRAVAGASLAEGLEPGIRAGVAAVARAVRAQDEARGGTLTAEEVDEALGADDAMRAHLAAQGRTIAALQAELSELRTEYDREAAGHLAGNKRAVAAESALATLRQAVGPFMPDLRCDVDATLALEAERQMTAGRLHTVGEARALVAAMDATPSEHSDTASVQTTDVMLAADLVRAGLRTDGTTDADYEARRKGLRALPTLLFAISSHPDTATLRAIRERAKNPEDVFRMAWDGLPPEEDCPTWDGLDETDRENYRPLFSNIIRSLLGDSGPSGGQGTIDTSDFATLTEEFMPTTPPDVAASEPQPTPEEDWRTLEAWLRDGMDPKNQRHAALARLRDEPRRAAEAMRERCIKRALKVAASFTDSRRDARQCGHVDIARIYRARAAGAKRVARAIRTLRLLKDSGPERSEKEGNPGA